MRGLILLTVIIVNAGCTTLRPIDGSPAELRQRMSVGELLKPGDRVLIVTADQKTHRFAVTAIGSGEIEGRKISLPVEQIVFLADMPPNVAGARRVGMTAVRVPWEDPGPAIATARALVA